jgi:hypothetical protein
VAVAKGRAAALQPRPAVRALRPGQSTLPGVCTPAMRGWFVSETATGEGSHGEMPRPSGFLVEEGD